MNKIYISYASEDLADVVMPLARRLKSRGLDVELNQWELMVGDSLKRKIEEALAPACQAIVVVSPAYIRKTWPNRELDLESRGRQIIFPVLNKISRSEVNQRWPMFGAQVICSVEEGLDAVADQLMEALRAAPGLTAAAQPSESELAEYRRRMLAAADTRDLQLIVSQLEDFLAHHPSQPQALLFKYEMQSALAVAGTMVYEVFSMVQKEDPRIARHQRRVSDLACAIAGEMRLSDEQNRFIRTAAMLHDVGNMQVPTEILNKAGKLTKEEFEKVKTHCRAGYEMLRDLGAPTNITDIMAQHHERIDGSGYPSGLKGERICQGARILAVADVVEAMTSEKPYRPAFSLDDALAEVEAKSGKLYDDRVVEACLAVFRKGLFAFTQQGP